LSLLNAEDGQKEITEQEKFLFSSADISDLDGILNAIKQGANINAIDTNGETAFTKVFENFNYELYNEERKFDEKTLIERTILIASKMLELGADINLFGYDGINALQQVAYSHNPTLMKFLLDNGANPNINYFPEDGQEYIKSTVLDTILSDYYVYDDEENLNQCETLLKNAGAE
jgi:ankyrin repeat protein